MAALAQMEHEIKRERVLDSISKRRKAGLNLVGRPHTIADSQIRSAVRLGEDGEPERVSQHKTPALPELSVTETPGRTGF